MVRKIYLVEDDTYVSRMYERAFRLNGYEIQTQTDGAKAVEELKAMTTPPDAILLDIIVENMSGIDVLRTIKKDERLRTVPVAVLTNSFKEENEHQFLELGADLYMIKIENTSADVIQRIGELIEKHQAI